MLTIYSILPLPKPMRFRSLHLAGLSLAVLLVALAAPVHAQQDADAYQYDIHYATSPATGAGGSAPEPEDARVRHALQGPEVTLLWAQGQEKTMENARFARHEEVMGMLMPKWSLARSAAEKTGWTALGREIQYDTFDVDFRRGDDDRTIAGRPAKNYVFEAKLTKRVGTSARKQHLAVTANLWVLEDRPFSWAPFAVFGTTGVNADPRLQAALAERLAERGTVGRAETNLSLEVLAEDDSVTGGSEQRFYVWIENLKSAEPPRVQKPMVSQETMRTVESAFKKDPQAFCETVLSGSTPTAAQETLTEKQQTAFIDSTRAFCERRFGQ